MMQTIDEAYIAEIAARPDGPRTLLRMLEDALDRADRAELQLRSMTRDLARLEAAGADRGAPCP